MHSDDDDDDDDDDDAWKLLRWEVLPACSSVRVNRRYPMADVGCVFYWGVS